MGMDPAHFSSKADPAPSDAMHSTSTFSTTPAASIPMPAGESSDVPDTKLPVPCRTLGEAVAVTDETRKRYRNRQWWAPTFGVRLPTGRQALADRCDAILVAVPDAVISGGSAAALWDLPIPRSVTRQLEITVPDAHPLVRRRGVRCRRRDVPAHSVSRLEDRPVIAPARLFVDLGSELSLPWLVSLGDAAMNRGLLDERGIVHALAESTGHRGIRRAREALALLDPRAESPPESIVRVILHEAGIDYVHPQYVVTDRDGAFVARVDLALEDLRIAVEYDGAHHLTPEQQAIDAVRRQRLEMLGWMVITVNSHDIHQPGRLVGRVRAALSHRRQHPA